MGMMMRKTLLAAMLACSTVALADQPAPIPPAVKARIDRILKATPLIDGHNDLPEQLRDCCEGKVEGLEQGSDKRAKPLMTDMARLRAGDVGGQFWSVYIPSEVTGDAAIRETIEQIDLVHRLCAAYPKDLGMAVTADDVVRVHKSGRVACLIGIEGGHQIGGNLAALRQFRALGAGYMTLTHFKNTDWADSATDDPVHHGITDFGRTVIAEMNRVGMLVDLSHVSAETMRAAIAATKAPVIFSHSDARALNDHPRNVPDDVLKLLPANGGVVMVNFYPAHLSADYGQWAAARAAEEARGKSLWQGQPERRAAALKAWDAANPAPKTPVSVVADHIEHIVQLAGHDHVGLGGDLDGIEAAVEGLGGVDGYPLIFAELIKRGWSDADLAKLAGGNVLRVMRQAEAVAATSGPAPSPQSPGNR
jgi:membrane dipeptidase